MRTLAKVKGRAHLVASEGFTGERWANPSCFRPNASHRTIGIIGCGSFSFGNIAYYIEKYRPGSLRGVMDINAARARSLAARYGAAYATVDVKVILSDPNIDLVYIASNHASHAAYAVAALDAGKHVHIEKPHVVSPEQLDALVAAMQRNPEQLVFMGFNRPRADLFTLLKKEISAETGPSMINWFIVGHEIPESHWYFGEYEGGRILGNLCHWTDLTLDIVGVENAFPCRLVPTATASAKSDFVTSIEFGDGSLASLTFSAKGETFEGVRETLNLHKGKLLIELKDFVSISIVRGHQRRRVRSQFRDHGHKSNILNSFRGAKCREPWRAPDRTYIVSTARLFLGVSEAHQMRVPVIVENPNASMTASAAKMSRSTHC